MKLKRWKKKKIQPGSLKKMTKKFSNLIKPGFCGSVSWMMSSCSGDILRLCGSFSMWFWSVISFKKLCWLVDWFKFCFPTRSHLLRFEGGKILKPEAASGVSVDLHQFLKQNQMSCPVWLLMEECSVPSGLNQGPSEIPAAAWRFQQLCWSATSLHYTGSGTVGPL